MTTYVTVLQLIVFTIVFLLPAYLGMRMGPSRGMDRWTGFVCGLTLNWLGVVGISMLEVRGAKCVRCGDVRDESNRDLYCRWCGE